MTFFLLQHKSELPFREDLRFIVYRVGRNGIIEIKNQYFPIYGSQQSLKRSNFYLRLFNVQQIIYFDISI